MNDSFDELYIKILNSKTKIAPDGEASFKNFQKDDKNFFIIGTEHYSIKAVDLIRDKIEKNVKNIPKSFLFLIEGIPDSDMPEIIYSYALGKKFNIPIEDPIKDPYSKEVLKQVSERGVNLNDAYLVLFIEMLKVFPDVNIVANRLSEMWNIQPSELIEAANSLYFEIACNEEKIKNTKNFLKNTMSKIREVSNELSYKNLKNILKKYEEKSNIFACIGKSHEEIFYKL